LTREGRANQLYSLYIEARRLVEDLTRSLGSFGSAAGQQQASVGQPAGGQLMLNTGSLLSSALIEVSGV